MGWKNFLEQKFYKILPKVSENEITQDEDKYWTKKIFFWNMEQYFKLLKEILVN